MVREGMIELVNKLRMLTDTVNDPTDKGNHWTDDDLQSELDLHVVELIRTQLIPSPKLLPNNTLSYLDYKWKSIIGRWLERPTVSFVNSTFIVQESNGAYKFNITDYTVNWSIPKITFLSDQVGKSFILTARVYDMNEAAAMIWSNKADRRAELFNWKTDNHLMNEDTVYQHCMERYQHYLNLSGVQFTRVIRTDQGVFEHGSQNRRW